MKIIQDNYKHKIVKCTNCGSLILLDSDTELLHNYINPSDEIHMCPCCKSTYPKVKIIEID